MCRALLRNPHVLEGFSHNWFQSDGLVLVRPHKAGQGTLILKGVGGLCPTNASPLLEALLCHNIRPYAVMVYGLQVPM